MVRKNSKNRQVRVNSRYNINMNNNIIEGNDNNVFFKKILFISE